MIYMDKTPDPSALYLAVSMVAERHPNLRAQFCSDPETGIPYKRLSPKSSIEITWHDSDTSDDHTAQAFAHRLLTAQTSTPIDIEKGPLVHMLVINGMQFHFYFYSKIMK